MSDKRIDDFIKYLKENEIEYEEFYNLKERKIADSDKKLVNGKIKKSTFVDRLSKAKTFIRRTLQESIRTKESSTNKDLYKIIREELETQGHFRTEDSWRNLRLALVCQCRAIGDELTASYFQSVDNPVPKSSRPKKTGRNLRVSVVKDEEYQRIEDALFAKNEPDEILISAMRIARLTGCRACEVPTVEIVDSDIDSVTIFIEGAKKTEKGKANNIYQRGLDRTFTLPLDYASSERAMLEAAIEKVEGLQDNDVKAYQERLRKLNRKLWPRRKVNIGFHSFRYTFGANLKKAFSGRSDRMIRIAAIMGHAHTDSQCDYGNARSGKSMFVPEPSEDTMAQVRSSKSSKFWMKKPGHENETVEEQIARASKSRKKYKGLKRGKSRSRTPKPE